MPGRHHSAVGRYVTRALADGSSTVGEIFDEMVTMTEQWLARADEARPDPPAIDRRIRAALVTAMKVGIPLLHDHVSRALGTDMFEPEGDRLVALALIDIYSHRLLLEEDASSPLRPGWMRARSRPAGTFGPSRPAANSADGMRHRWAPASCGAKTDDGTADDQQLGRCSGACVGEHA